MVRHSLDTATALFSTYRFHIAVAGDDEGPISTPLFRSISGRDLLPPPACKKRSIQSIHHHAERPQVHLMWRGPRTALGQSSTVNKSWLTQQRSGRRLEPGNPTAIASRSFAKPVPTQDNPSRSHRPFIAGSVTSSGAQPAVSPTPHRRRYRIKSHRPLAGVASNFRIC